MKKHNVKLIALGGIDYYTLNTNAIFPAVLQFQKDGNGTNGASIRGTRGQEELLLRKLKWPKIFIAAPLYHLLLSRKILPW